MNKIEESFELDGKKFLLEHGEIGRQADASVICSVEDTVVMASCTLGNSETQQDFLPLTVDYQEKAYAAGRIPGGFFRREGRPTEKETLTCRLIDRSIRPLFPANYRFPIHVVCNVLSYSPAFDSDIPAMIAAFAAVTLSGVPFSDVLGAVRVARVQGSTVLHPTVETMEDSSLDMVIAGSDKGILMVESEAAELSEQQLVESLEYGHKAVQTIIGAIRKLDEKAGRPKQNWTVPVLEPGKLASLEAAGTSLFEDAYKILDKQQRQTKLDEVREQLSTSILGQEPELSEENQFKVAVKKLESKVVRNGMLAGGQRIDGRTPTDIREISVRTGVLPRTHGSALFTRGETQALVVCTLGSGRDEQKIETLAAGEVFDRFLVHYNMPPFATGEAGRIMSPKRREVGHGRLAKRALMPVMPNLDDFGYTVRLVSEIMESNGSSSMASVCGGSLSLMDAGVQIEAPVAGIAMGLIQGESSNVILSDILGDEDHLGDMDFKVAGTARGITALQMDIKLDSIPRKVFEEALNQAREGRLHILSKMNEVLSKPRKEMSSNAPRIIKMKINVEKIREVIGKGGSTIKSLTEATGTKIDVSDDGSITIAGPDMAHCDNAKNRIEAITAELEIGKIYEGKVAKILDFGAIISLLPGRDGLLHISQISKERINKVSDYLSQAQTVRVKVIKTDERGRVRLSMKDVDSPESEL